LTASSTHISRSSHLTVWNNQIENGKWKALGMQNAERRVQNCGEQSSGFYPTQSVLTVGLLPPLKLVFCFWVPGAASPHAAHDCGRLFKASPEREFPFQGKCHEVTKGCPFPEEKVAAVRLTERFLRRHAPCRNQKFSRALVQRRWRCFGNLSVTS